jgi:hypothetical protein
MSAHFRPWPAKGPRSNSPQNPIPISLPASPAPHSRTSRRCSLHFPLYSSVLTRTRLSLITPSARPVAARRAGSRPPPPWPSHLSSGRLFHDPCGRTAGAGIERGSVECGNQLADHLLLHAPTRPHRRHRPPRPSPRHQCGSRSCCCLLLSRPPLLFS